MIVAVPNREASTTPNCPECWITENTQETARFYRFDSRPGDSFLM